MLLVAGSYGQVFEVRLLSVREVPAPLHSGAAATHLFVSRSYVTQSPGFKTVTERAECRHEQSALPCDKHKLTSLLWRQGFLRCTDGSDARVVLKRVKRRVEVHAASQADPKNLLLVLVLHCCQCSLHASCLQPSPDGGQSASDCRP